MLHDILFMLLMMLAGFALPLAAALWRYWSKMVPRALALRYDDQQAFLYRLTEGLNSAGFRRKASSGPQVIFEAGLRIGFGPMPVTVDFETPGTARIVGSSRYVKYIKRWFPAAQDQRYDGASPVGKVVKRFAYVYGTILLLFAGALGASAVYDRSTRDALGRSPLDVEQTLDLMASEAKQGIEMRNILIEKTSRIQTISVPPGTLNGTRLRFPRRGMSGGFASQGDLYLIVTVK